MDDNIKLVLAFISFCIIVYAIYEIMSKLVNVALSLLWWILVITIICIAWYVHFKYDSDLSALLDSVYSYVSQKAYMVSGVGKVADFILKKIE